MSVADGNAAATPVIKTEPVDHPVWDETIPGSNVDDDGDDEDDDDDDDDDDEDEDIDYDEDAEAEEIARRLGDQLWADISKAQQAQAAQPVAATATTTPPVSASAPPLPTAAATPNVPASVAHEAAAILSMKMILAFSEKDFAVRSTLASTIVPDSRGSSVLDVLTAAATNGSISTTIARALGPLMNALSTSETLFSGITLGAHRPPAVPYAYALPTPPPPSMLPHVHHHHPVTSVSLPSANTTDLAKRKRTELGYSPTPDESLPNAKRQHHNPPTESLQSTITQAAEKISQTFALHMDKPVVDPALVTSIRPQLRQVYVFASTSTATSPVSSSPPRELQEVGGLIQVLGVVTGVQIAPIHGNATLDVVDTDTAVYPCPEPSCSKIFSKSIFLRAHQHTVHNTTTGTTTNNVGNTTGTSTSTSDNNIPAIATTTEDRPHRCTRCSASFTRLHDLKRHERSHDRTGWQCAACLKTFSRRDAIKRHRDGARAKREDDPCGTADEIEIELEPRATGAGTGAAAGGGNDDDNEAGVLSDDDEPMEDTDADEDDDSDGEDSNGDGEDDDNGAEKKEEEEGEIDSSVLETLRKTVCDLHGLLQSVVAKVLSGGIVSGGANRPSPTTGPAGAAGPQASTGVAGHGHGQTSAALAGVIATAAQPAVQGTAAAGPPLGAPSFANASSASGPTPSSNETTAAMPSLSYGLSEEQAKMLEAAISNAALAARAQVEAEQGGPHDDDDDDIDFEDEGSDDPEDEDEDADMESVVLPALAYPPNAPAATGATAVATVAAARTVQALSVSEDSDDDMEAVVIPDGP